MLIGIVAQLVRVPACHAGGREFEPRQSRHLRKKVFIPSFFVPRKRQRRELFLSSSEERAECGVVLPSIENTKAKHEDTFNASDSRQHRRSRHLKRVHSDSFCLLFSIKNYNLLA